MTEIFAQDFLCNLELNYRDELSGAAMLNAEEFFSHALSSDLFWHFVDVDRMYIGDNFCQCSCSLAHP